MQLNFDSFIDNMPGYLWIKDVQSRYLACNQRLLNIFCLKSKKEIIEHADVDLPWAIYADIYVEGDKQALSGETKTFLQPVLLKDNTQLIITTRKTPIFDHVNKVIGVQGVVNLITTPKKTFSISQLSGFDSSLINFPQSSIQYTLTDNFDSFNLSKREAMCLFYMIRGKTAKQIGDILCISKRTVEVHLENIKIKFGCKSKSEVIGKAIEAGFIQLIPHDYLIKKVYHHWEEE